MLSKWRSSRLSGCIGGMRKGSTRAWGTEPRLRLNETLWQQDESRETMEIQVNA